jgi:protein arginine kinase
MEAQAPTLMAGGWLLRTRTPAREVSTLVEARYASLTWASQEGYGALAVDAEGSVAVMAQEEDHLRIQSILPGLQVQSARAKVTQAAFDLAVHAPFAWLPGLGFLTASPANVGAAERTSVLLHLPGLEGLDRLASAINAARCLGCSVRGLFGEGTRAVGAFFQVSNLPVDAHGAAAAADRVQAAAGHLVDAERDARRDLYGADEARTALAARAEAAADAAWSGTLTAGQALEVVSLRRLAMAEQVVDGSLPEAGAWVSALGLVCAVAQGAAPVWERYQAVRHTALLRSLLRKPT